MFLDYVFFFILKIDLQDFGAVALNGVAKLFELLNTVKNLIIFRNIFTKKYECLPKRLNIL